MQAAVPMPTTSIPTVSITLPCPAKLNLFLHITGRRSDGYHDLQTAFQLLDYGDEITIEVNDSDKVSVTAPIAGLAQEDNLIYRAAHMLKSYTGTDMGAHITLDKQLPIGGGIGGGSSDAASTLLGLNHLWQTHLPVDTLAEIGRQLGADIPVFVHGYSAWAEGIGEKLTPLELEEKYYLVLAPQCHISTAEIFCHKDLTRDTLAITVAAFLERGGKNDCQPLVESLFPQVKDAVKWLSRYSQAQLTGTGACVFASFSSKEAAQAVFAEIPEHLSGFIAKGVNQSSLHKCLAKI